jgi:hypothetical protein
MNRVQIQLTGSQVQGLRRRSLETGTPVAALIREAVDAWLGDVDRRQRIERAVAAVGGFHSGIGDVAAQHDRYLDPDERS